MLVFLKSSVPLIKLLKNTKYILSAFPIGTVLKAKKGLFTALCTRKHYSLVCLFVVDLFLFFKQERGKWLPRLGDNDCLKILSSFLCDDVYNFMLFHYFFS